MEAIKGLFVPDSHPIVNDVLKILLLRCRLRNPCIYMHFGLYWQENVTLILVFVGCAYNLADSTKIYPECSTNNTSR